MVGAFEIQWLSSKVGRYLEAVVAGRDEVAAEWGVAYFWSGRGKTGCGLYWQVKMDMWRRLGCACPFYTFGCP